MSAIKITKLPLATLAGAVLFIMAGLMLSVTQARAETKKDQAVATSLAEVTLEPEAKLLVILGTGEKVKGKPVDISDGALSVSTKYGIRTLRESEIVQIFQVKGTSRGRGALYGALIGAAGALAVDVVDTEGDPFAEFVLIAPLAISSGAAIGALAPRDKKTLVYQNPEIAKAEISPPSRPSSSYGKFSFDISAGRNFIGNEPAGATRIISSGSGYSIACQAIYRISPLLGLGGEVLFTDTGTWEWETETETRYISYSNSVDYRFYEKIKTGNNIAAGPRIYFFTRNGKHETRAVGGFSFLYSGERGSGHEVDNGTEQSWSDRVYSSWLYCVNGGVGYHYYLNQKLGIGAEFQIYMAGVWEFGPLTRFSFSLSLRP